MGGIVDAITGRGARRAESRAQQALDLASAGKSFRGGGLNVASSPTMITVGRTGERNQALNRIKGLYAGKAQDIRDLMPLVAPGIGRLTESAIQTLENKRSSAIGNLRENLSRRRVLGSSFAADAEARANLEYDQAIQQAKAESFLQELDITNQLINQSYEADLSAFNTVLSNLNLEAEIATSLATGGQAALSSMAGIQSQLAVEAQSGAGSLQGLIFGPSLTKVGSAIAGKLPF